jgi:hypothetical protein
MALGQFSGESRLADLPGAENGNYRVVPQQSFEAYAMIWPVDHVLIVQ